MNSNLKKTVTLYNCMYYLMLVLALGLATMYFQTQQDILGFILVAIVVVIGLISLIGVIRFRRTLSDKILNDSLAVTNREKQYMEQWEFPYALVKPGGEVCWYNRSFGELFRETLSESRSSQIENLLGAVSYPEEGGSYTDERLIGGETYRIELTQESILDAETGELSELLYSVSLVDVTRERALEQENANIRPVVALIYIDNYDQALGSVEETRRPLLEAMVYTRLNDLAAQLKGVLTRMEKDRLQLVFPQETLDNLKATKFQILEEVRKLALGNRLPVTLSVGVGLGSSLEQSYEYARASVDLAMSRGGDQAVLKNKENTVFYGGRTSGVEKNTRVRARLMAHAIRDVVAEAKRVLIMGHTNPDLDSLGSALGFYRAVRALDKEAYIVLPEPHPAVDTLYERVRQDREYNGRVILEEEASGLSGDGTLLVVVDVNRPSIVAAPALLEQNSRIIVIDHHRTAVDFISNTVISYVEPYSSSASEMVAELLQYMTDRVELTAVEADGLLSGIELDTKNFITKTGIRTFDAAAFLRRSGADSGRVRQLFKNDIEEYRVRTGIVSGAEVLEDHIAISHWDGRKEANAVALAAGAADELLDIKGVNASFVLTQLADMINVSARSNGEINVQMIMEKIGGGGHLTGAGAQLTDQTMEEALVLVARTIEAYLVSERS